MTETPKDPRVAEHIEGGRRRLEIWVAEVSNSERDAHRLSRCEQPRKASRVNSFASLLSTDAPLIGCLTMVIYLRPWST